jgi:hypothetical protein
MEDSYGKRLRRAASEDFSRYWSGHRWLGWIASGVVSLLAGIWLHGVNVARYIDVLPAMVLLLTILLSYLHSRRKGAEALDLALQNEITQRDGVIADRNQAISVLQEITPQKHKEQRVREWINQMSPRQREFIEWLLDHGEIEESLMAKNAPPGDVGQAIQWGLILPRREMRGQFGFTMLFINPDYRDALYAAVHIQPGS